MSIILLRGGVATRVSPAEFALESSMQAQLAANPNILPLHEIRSGAELVVVVREMSISSGYIDLLGIDQEGEVYVIETKLARNPDRRTVLAQALDYGAALWSDFGEPGAFISGIDELLIKAGRPTTLEAIRVAHAGDEAAAARVLERIMQNVASGAFRFVVPMDRISSGLKDLVRYINENSRFTVYLVELEQYEEGDLTVVVPHLFGAEVRKSVGNASPGGRGHTSDVDEFVEDLERRVSDGELGVTEAIAVKELLRVVLLGEQQKWITGARGRINVSPRFLSTGATKSPFTLGSDGRFVLNLGYVSDVSCWRDWGLHVLSILGRSGDPRQYPEFRSPDWSRHATVIATAVEELLP